MIDAHFVILGSLLSIFGGLTYVRDTLRGKVQPNRVSWFLWALAPLIAFSAEIRQGVGLASLMTFAVGFNPLMVFCASFVNRKAAWKLTRLDMVCGVLSLVGIALWLATGSGNAAIFFSILADGLAGIPTLVKAYKAPESESYLAFLFGAINASITLLAIDSWSFSHWGFPAYILTICIILVVFIKVRPRLALRKTFAKEDVRPLP